MLVTALAPVRRLAACFFLVLTAVLVALPAGADVRVSGADSGGPRGVASGSTREVKIGAQMVISVVNVEERCRYAIFVQFPQVAGAMSYNVVVQDKHPQINATRNYTGPPFNDNHEGYKTPGGAHWFGGLTGGAGPAPCPTDPYEGGRFEVLKAVAIFDGKDRIVGAVRGADGAGVSKVRVSAKGPKSASATTNGGGAYSMRVKKGAYKVSAPKGFCVVGIKKCTNTKSVSVNGTESVNFTGRGRDIQLSGTVKASDCSELGTCTLEPVSGVTVTAKGDGGESAVTDDQGAYAITVSGGDYRVVPEAGTAPFAPPYRDVSVGEKDKSGLDFIACADEAPPGALPAQADENAQDQTGAARDAADLCQGSYIKGRVTDSFKEGVPNVRIIVKGKGGKKEEVTSKEGYYEVKLARLAKRGNYTVTALSSEFKQIDPKVRKVTVRPGKDGFAAFTVATGKLHGSVFGLACPAPVVKETCGKRTRWPGAKVRVAGGPIGEKFVATAKDGDPKFDAGEWEMKVPVGEYKVSVVQPTVANAPGADVCKEDPAIPVIPSGKKLTERKVKCEKEIKVPAKKGARTKRDFVAVPRVIVPDVALLKFDRGSTKPERVSRVKSGLVPPLGDKAVFYERDKGARYEVRCVNACVSVEVQARDLLGQPVKDGIVEGLAATPISPALGVSDSNSQGRMCPVVKGDTDCNFTTGRDRLDADGRALVVYFVPGIVAGRVLQQPGDSAKTLLTARVTAPKRRDAVVTEPLEILPNVQGGRPGSTITLDKDGAALLNALTDPYTKTQGVINGLKLLPNACKALETFFFDKLLAGVETVTFRSKTVKVKVLTDFCDKVNLPLKAVRPILENLYDRLLSTWVFEHTPMRKEGLLESFGVRGLLDDPFPSPADIALKLVPRTTTEANEYLADWMRAWRVSHGEGHFSDPNDRNHLVHPPLEAGETIQVLVHEVSQFDLRSFQVGEDRDARTYTLAEPTKAVHFSLSSGRTPTPANKIIKEGYDPVEWLR